MKFLSLLVIVLLISCWKTEPSTWTKEERQAFEEECSNTLKFEPGIILLKYFDREEMDSIKLYEVMGSIKTDSVILYPKELINQRSYLEFTVIPQMTFNTQNKYYFQIGSTEPYILEDMKMIVWPQFTQDENWGCVMGDFTMDGEILEHMGNIRINKR